MIRRKNRFRLHRKGRYPGPMNVHGTLIPGGVLLLRRVATTVLSREARVRLKWMDFYERHGRNARLTCEHFGISPDTFYRWRRRYDPRRLPSLEDDRRTRRPQRVRQPQTPPEVVERIQALREQYPRWGKRSWPSCCGGRAFASRPPPPRILTRLKVRGLIVEPRARRRKAAWRPRPHAQRNPQGLRGAPARGPRAGGHPGRRGPARPAAEAVHRAGHGEPLRCREELYQVWEVEPNLDAHRAQLQAWAHIYNTIRQHQHLGYLTPLEYCERHT